MRIYLFKDALECLDLPSPVVPREFLTVNRSGRYNCDGFGGQNGISDWQVPKSMEFIQFRAVLHPAFRGIGDDVHLAFRSGHFDQFFDHFVQFFDHLLDFRSEIQKIESTQETGA